MATLSMETFPSGSDHPARRLRPIDSLESENEVEALLALPVPVPVPPTVPTTLRFVLRPGFLTNDPSYVPMAKPRVNLVATHLAAAGPSGAVGEDTVHGSPSPSPAHFYHSRSVADTDTDTDSTAGSEVSSTHYRKWAYSDTDEIERLGEWEEWQWTEDGDLTVLFEEATYALDESAASEYDADSESGQVSDSDWSTHSDSDSESEPDTDWEDDVDLSSSTGATSTYIETRAGSPYYYTGHHDDDSDYYRWDSPGNYEAPELDPELVYLAHEQQRARNREIRGIKEKWSWCEGEGEGILRGLFDDDSESEESGEMDGEEKVQCAAEDAGTVEIESQI
ncbi:hypothetical protein C8F01DRAFT_1370425 [Mycena amicta]|nr:hypothetical protein C8F01DRAFT_1370425 [Mycena amicta]